MCKRKKSVQKSIHELIFVLQMTTSARIITEDVDKNVLILMEDITANVMKGIDYTQMKRLAFVSIFD